MVTLAERLESDYKTALKARDRLRVETIRLIKAAMQRLAIEKQKPLLDDQEIQQVVSQQVKQRRETIEAVKSSGRQDILDQAKRELDILAAYLPPQLSPEAITQLVEEALNTVGQNQGQIMKYVMGKAAGSADGKMVSQLVSERLRRASG